MLFSADALADVLSAKGHNVVATASVIAPLCAVMLKCSTKVVTAVRDLGERITKQILTIERFFGLGVRSDSIARKQADELQAAANGHDNTGPITIVN